MLPGKQLASHHNLVEIWFTDNLVANHGDLLPLVLPEAGNWTGEQYQGPRCYLGNNWLPITTWLRYGSLTTWLRYATWLRYEPSRREKPTTLY